MAVGSPGKSKNGFTLIEMVVAIGVSGVLMVGLVASVGQVLKISASADNHVMTAGYLQNSGQWLGLDILAAQNVTLAAAPDPDGFPLTLKRTDSVGNEYQVVYELTGQTLYRLHYTNRAAHPDPDSTTLVANSIDPANTRVVTGGGNAIVIILTATSGVSEKQVTRTEVYRFVPRPLLVNGNG